MIKKIILGALFIYIFTMAAFAYNGNFVELCETGNPEQVREAIEAGAPVNSVIGGFRNALMAAIDRKGKSLPLRTLSEKIAASSDNKSNTTQISQNDVHEIVSILIENGANVNYHNFFGGCPLSSAIAKGDPFLVKMLLNAGAEVDPKLGDNKESLLSMLFSDKKTPVPTPEILRILLEANGGVNDRNGNPLLLQAFSQEKAISAELIRVLLDAGADVNGQDARGRTPLMLAAHSDSSVVRLLLERGADVNYCNPYGDCPLSSAILNSDPSLVKMLLNAGAEVDPELGKNKKSLLSMIFTDRRASVPTPEILRILLEANGGAYDRNGNSLLLQAFSQEKAISAELIRVLLDAGADVNKTAGRQDPRTPLMVAVSDRRFSAEVIKLLLESGADANLHASQKSAYTAYGDTALIIASVKQSSPEIIRLLVSHGADVNACNGDGITALILATRFNPNARIIQTLIYSGADVNAITDNGRTALMEAALRHKNAEIARILIDAGALIDVEIFNLAEGTATKEIIEALRDGYRRQRRRL